MSWPALAWIDTISWFRGATFRSSSSTQLSGATLKFLVINGKWDELRVEINGILYHLKPWQREELSNWAHKRNTQTFHYLDAPVFLQKDEVQKVVRVVADAVQERLKHLVHNGNWNKLRVDINGILYPLKPWQREELSNWAHKRNTETFHYLDAPVFLQKDEVQRVVESSELFPVIKSEGAWTFKNATGSYKYDDATHSLTTQMKVNDTRLPDATMKVVVANVAAKGNGFEFQPQRELSSVGIIQHNGNIMTDIQMQADRQRMFVLPSQLNAAEYSTNSLDEQQLKEYGLNDYLYDGTGGPRGQLSVDLGVAQFILDNAHNITTGTKGINNVRCMGNIEGIRLNNGYLHVQNPNVQAFSDALSEMTVLGIRNIPVRGLKAFGNPNNIHSFVDHTHKVDLVYASAVPYGSYNNEENVSVRNIAQMTLYGQYLASLRLAIQARSRDVFLMPLGGGVFKNKPEDIKSAMISAVETVSDQLQESDIRVYVLTWNGNPQEARIYV